MSKRLYYNCPIKAIYMMREFGIAFDNEEAEEVADDASEVALGYVIPFAQYFVAKESERIFEEREADFVWYKRTYSFPKVIQINKAEESLTWADNFEHKIIMRDNKQFFMPEVEHWMPLPKPPKED